MKLFKDFKRLPLKSKVYMAHLVLILAMWIVSFYYVLLIEVSRLDALMYVIFSGGIILAYIKVSDRIWGIEE